MLRRDVQEAPGRDDRPQSKRTLKLKPRHGNEARNTAGIGLRRQVETTGIDEHRVELADDAKESSGGEGIGGSRAGPTNPYPTLAYLYTGYRRENRYHATTFWTRHSDRGTPPRTKAEVKAISGEYNGGAEDENLNG